jgi:serine protease Do
MMSLRKTMYVALCGLSVMAMTATVMPSPVWAKAAPESFAPLVETLTPAVVNVFTTQKVKQDADSELPEGTLPPDQMEEFKNFMERFGGGMNPPSDEGAERDMQSLGSGFVIDPAGYIVTNNHVVDGADEIKVRFQDKAEYVAKLVGRDAKTDLALLKIEGKQPFPSVKFGNSDASKVGDWVIAIGNPFGLGGSVTAGIISARGRNINSGPFDDFIQTDAAINRGNSGGPMFNTEGEVIGINSAIFSPSGGNIGIGFAVPSSMAEPVLKQLREVGKIHRAWLGVKIRQVTEEMSDSVGLKGESGAFVEDVTAGSPAEKAQFKAGDIILSFNGKPIEEMHFLPRIVAETKIASTVPVVVWRDGKEMTIKVTLAEMKDEEVADAAKSKEDKGAVDKASEKMLGMQLSEMTAELKSQLGKKDVPSKGVVVVGVDAKGVSAARGIRRGDVIISAAQQEVSSLKGLHSILDDAKKTARKFILLRVWRAGETTFVTVPLAEKEKAK